MNKIRIKYIYLLLTFFMFEVVCADNSGQVQKDESLVTVVVIDPGHGGKDPGTTGGNVEEKNVVLDIALKLGRYIETNFPEIEVIYTRKTDVFIPVYRRAAIANKADADLFISIHANAVDYKYVQGTETFVLGQHRSEDNLEVAKKENSVILLEDDYTTTYEGFDPHSPESYIMFELVQDEYKEQSIALANAIQNEFRLQAQRKDRSVKEAGFVVLRRISMPGVLVETGFLSNTSERNYLNSDKGRDEIAASIFRAFKAYKTDIEQKSSFHLVTGDESEQAATQKTSVLTANSEVQEESNTEKQPEENVYYSVQIMALQKKIETKPENFNGLDNVFRVDSPTVSRYFVGKFNKLEDAELNKELLLSRYEEAFVVAFRNNELISVKMLLGNEN
ncbi:N-acetylmuramoyl-L-alanine amidase family protein [Maribellus sediminis]|uniref:N-acetylmuramoyl-L-alanine amidase family protein n=1 Tax=Maribellus sediminis TaxID=2696285 RepID=UPI001431C0C6|nr:N-acetylmuramoyl-L-alanine amidase [Maribellus sediminis]